MKGSDSVFQWTLDAVRDWPTSSLNAALSSVAKPGKMPDPIAIDFYMLRAYYQYLRKLENLDAHFQITYFVVTPSAAARIDDFAAKGDIAEGARILKELWGVTGNDKHPYVLLVVGNRWKGREQWVMHSFVILNSG